MSQSCFDPRTICSGNIALTTLALSVAGSISCAPSEAFVESTGLPRFPRDDWFEDPDAVPAAIAGSRRSMPQKQHTL